MRKKIVYALPDDPRRLSWWKTLITWICRILVGGTFVFSGIVKAIDPWGTLYKMEDYVGVMHISWLGPELLITGAFILFTLEFMVGIFLLTGSFRRFSPVMVLLFMLFMLPLTGWIAVSDPVPDCGCFGDALIISNWATFWKNVAITACGVWLLIYNRRTHWLITPALQWIGFVLTAVYVILIGVVGYRVQPLVDFREYKIGEPLVTHDSENSGSHFIFQYEKGGVRKEFGENDELPDEADGWKYVGRKEIISAAPVDSVVQKAFRVWSADDGEDVTDEVMAGGGERQLVLLIPSLKDVSIASTWKINSLQEWAAGHDIGFIAVVAGTSKQIDEWKDVSMADYPIYIAEDTAIKEVARGNPAVVYTVNGNIAWKSTLSALRGDDFLDEEGASDGMALYRDLKGEAYDVSAIYLSALAVLIMFSFLPLVFGRCSFFPRKKRGVTKINDDDTAPHGESSSPDTPAQ